MAKIKGIDLVNLRKIFRKQAPSVEKEFLARLDEDGQNLYLLTLTTSWNPVEAQDMLYRHAGEMLFPQETKKYLQLGKAVSEISYTGIYKMFLKILAPEVMAQRWAKMWQLHHDSGKPSYTLLSNKHIELTVRDYPGLPAITRQLITGHISKYIELSGIKSFSVHPGEDDPNNWRWHIQWDA